MEELKLELKLELNHTYLLKFGIADGLYSVTVLLITDKAWHLRWNNGLDSYDKWEEKEVLSQNYSIVEDISDFVVEPKVENSLHVETTLVQCYVCKGFGTVPDPNSTGGTKPCPLCLGSKMIPEITKIS